MYGSAHYVQANSITQEEIKEMLEVNEEQNENEIPPEAVSVTSSVFIDNTRRMLLDQMSSHIRITRMQGQLINQLSNEIDELKKVNAEILTIVSYIKDAVKNKPIEQMERSRTPKLQSATPRVLPIRNIAKPQPKK